MVGYVSSVLGAVILGVIVDVVMPSGEMHKYIKGMYSIFIVFVLLTPITKLFNVDFDLYNLFSSEKVSVDDNYVEYVTSMRAQSLTQYIETKLQEEGITGAVVSVEYEQSGLDFEIKNITINISKLVIESKDKHINKYDIIRECIKKYVDIEEERIIFNE